MRKLTYDCTTRANRIESYIKAKRPILLMLAVFIFSCLTPSISLALSLTDNIPIGSHAYGVAVNEQTNKVYVADPDGFVKVIDGNQNTIIQSIGVGAEPWGIAINPNTNKVYVANNASGDISVIDGDTDSIVNTIPVGINPRVVSVNPDTNMVYVGSWEPKVYIINGNTDMLVHTIEAPLGSINGIAINPTTNRLYVAEATGWVSVFDAGNYSFIEQIPVGQNPYSLAINPANNRIYVTREAVNNLAVIDGNTSTIISSFSTGQHPRGIGINVAKNRLYVANAGENFVSVIDATTGDRLADVAVDNRSSPDPFYIAFNASTNKIYASTWRYGSLSVIEENLSTIPVGSSIAYGMNTNLLLASAIALLLAGLVVLGNRNLKAFS